MQDTFTETRKVKDAAGKTRTCTYTLKYNAATKTVNKSKSKVACKPNTKGKQTVEKFEIPVSMNLCPSNPCSVILTGNRRGSHSDLYSPRKQDRYQEDHLHRQ